jgi:hypothetical protein
MKNLLLTMTLMASFGAFAITSNAFSNSDVTSAICCEGEHKCDDKCKKGKDGKCDVTASNKKGSKHAGHSCSGHSTKKASKAQKADPVKKETKETAPKS